MKRDVPMTGCIYCVYIEKRPKRRRINSRQHTTIHPHHHHRHNQHNCRKQQLQQQSLIALRQIASISMPMTAARMSATFTTQSTTMCRPHLRVCRRPHDQQIYRRHRQKQQLKPVPVSTQTASTYILLSTPATTCWWHVHQHHHHHNRHHSQHQCHHQRQQQQQQPAPASMKTTLTLPMMCLVCMSWSLIPNQLTAPLPILCMMLTSVNEKHSEKALRTRHCPYASTLECDQKYGQLILIFHLR